MRRCLVVGAAAVLGASLLAGCGSTIVVYRPPRDARPPFHHHGVRARTAWLVASSIRLGNGTVDCRPRGAGLTYRVECRGAFTGSYALAYRGPAQRSAARFTWTDDSIPLRPRRWYLDGGIACRISAIGHEAAIRCDNGRFAMTVGADRVRTAP